MRLGFFVVSTVLAALTTLIVAYPHLRPVSAALVILGFGVAEFFSTGFREDVRVSVSNVVVLVAVIIGGAPLAAVAAIGCIPAIAMRSTDMPVVRVLFNWGQYTLAGAAAGLIYESVVGALGASFPGWQSLAASFLAAAVFSVTNYLLLAGVITLSTVDTFWSTFRTVRYPVLLQIPYVGIAVLSVVVLQRGSVWALTLMAVPALIARYGLLAFHRVDESYDRLVRSFVKAIEIKDLYTRGHSERVAELALHVAEELGVGYEERRLTRYAALLHDVGKIGVALCVINKAGPLDDDEFAQIKKHPTIGGEILHDIDFLAPAIDIIRYHHERLDGRGYPHGIGDAELSDIVRIVTVADAFDAMTSTRSYRRALCVAAAVAELRRCAGSQFDPRMVEALAVVAERINWQPTIEFASEAELNGAAVPMVGTFEQRLTAPVRDVG